MFGLSIRSLLSGLFILLAAVIGAQGFLSLSKIAAVNASTVDIATSWLPSVASIRKMGMIIQGVRTTEARHLLITNPADFADAEQRLTGRIAELEAERKHYEPLITNPEENAAYQVFSNHWDEYKKLDHEMISQSHNTNKQRAGEMFANETLRTFNALAADIEKLVQINESGAQAATNAAAAAYESARSETFAVLGLGLILAIGAVAFSFFGVSRPIGFLTGAMASIADGKTETEVPGAERKDEIGRMAAAVQVFRDNMIRTRELEAEAKKSEAQRAEERKRELHDLATRFEAAIGGIVDGISSSATDLESAAGTLTRTAEMTQQLSGNVATASEQASANVQSVASSADEMSSSVNEISRQVQESSNIAREAVNQAQKTDARIGELSQAAGRIGDVVKLITAIAEQTNLLALNATIEAARAGEAGKGFAVVAQEVKALAAQTAKATDEIGNQITAMQTATKESVAAIKEIGVTIDRVAEIASAIATAVEEQGAATTEIARNVQQAAHGTAQVAGNIADVNRGASETGTASSQVLSAARSLSGQGAKLKIEVDKFLATVRAA